MNIIEAISSGLPFKRKDWEDFYMNVGYKQFDTDDILALDWIIDTSFESNNQLTFPIMETSYGF